MVDNHKPSLKELKEKIDRLRTEGKVEEKSSKNITAFDICVELTAPIALGGVLGYIAINKFSAPGYWFVIFLFLGIIAGGVAFYRIIKKL